MFARPVSLARTRAHRSLASAALLGSLLLAPALHAAPFTQPDADFTGRVFAAGAVLPGSEITLNGQGFKPGQRITLSRGGQVLNPTAYVADAEGRFSAKLNIPADAVPARHPVVVEVAGPDAALVFDLKISPDVPVAGEKDFRLQSNKLVPGLYQAAYSAKSNAVFVTSAVGRPPVTNSQLLKVDPKSLKITAQVTPEKAAGRDDGHVYAVYGVAVDDDKGTVWVTNTRDNTAAVYNQSDLSLVKQFERGAAAHSRDVIVATKQNKAYVSEVGVPTLAVFSTETLAPLPKVQIESGIRGEDFSPMSLALDAATNRLFTVSMSTSQLAVIDTATDKVLKVIDVPGAVSASGVAFDPKTNRAFVASQGSDNVVIVDVNSGEVVNTVGTGAGTLNVVFDPVKSRAYVSNRGANTLTVLDVDGNIVANLPTGTFPNQAQVDNKGNVFLVNKARGAEDPQGDQITRITPRR